MHLPWTKSTRKSTRRAILWGVLNFLLFGVLTVFGEQFRLSLAQSRPFLVTLVAIAMVLFISINLLWNISIKIDDMARPVRTTLLDAKEAYKRASDVVLKARNDVLAVHTWASADYQPVKNSETNRDRYFANILEVAVRHRLKYKRIVQMSSSSKLSETRNKQLLYHLADCAKVTQASNFRIQVRISEPLYLVNFLLVDGKSIFVQLDNMDEETGLQEFSKCIFIEDGTGDVISVFQTMFDEIEGRSRVVRAEELAGILFPS